jgi:hypothetical protein
VDGKYAWSIYICAVCLDGEGEVPQKRRGNQRREAGGGSGQRGGGGRGDAAVQYLGINT